jgi:hypothetical protein
MQPNPYIIGDIPIVDPCKKCLIKVMCHDLCKSKILWLQENPPKISKVRIKVRRKRRSK